MTSAIGGTHTIDGLYIVHTFTENGSLIFTKGGTCEVLVLAGGGAGGNSTNSIRSGGGGGAGGLILDTLTLSGSLDIVVGAGGLSGRPSNNGEDSELGTYLTAFGGGFGAHGDNATEVGGDGGSGGGSRGKDAAPGLGTPGQGNDGGSGISTGLHRGAGGGGGAGGPGGPAISNRASKAGIGLSSSITGTPTIYGTGGTTFDRSPSDEPSNTGNGGTGGNAQADGGAGGSGLVIVRYLLPLKTSITRTKSGLVRMNRHP